jgi:hypothetical protein
MKQSLRASIACLSRLCQCVGIEDVTDVLGMNFKRRRNDNYDTHRRVDPCLLNSDDSDLHNHIHATLTLSIDEVDISEWLAIYHDQPI